jgi:transcriptional regulator NrdR family protein
MNCPQCQAATAVIEKRDGNRRRRECTDPSCGLRFNTFEILATELHSLQDDRRLLEDLGRRLGAVMEGLAKRPDGADTQPASLDLELPT